jgi:NAD(P)-dependent dehydrogenase (short-subunit alcohol dehydrogenase family)
MIQPISAHLEGRVCMVTGANAGIGYEIVRDLASLGATVVMVCRNRTKGEHARNALAKETGNQKLELAVVDLAEQKEIRRFVADFLPKHSKLHVLVNNAAVWLQKREVTHEGIERMWATNVLNYFLLTELLLERMIVSAPSRLINVASAYAGGLDLSDVQFERRRFSGSAAYMQSKQANRMLTWAWARRLAKKGVEVTANAMHPGAVATELLHKGFPGSGGRSPAHGADTASWLAADPSLEHKSDQFWMDREARRCEFRGEADEERLFSLCQQMTSSK